MKKYIRASINNINLTSNFQSRVIELISMLPEEQHENALAILLGATEEIFLGEVKVEKSKQPTDTNYQTIDFNHLTLMFTVEYRERDEIHISHDFTPEEWQSFKEDCLNLTKKEILNRAENKGKSYGWVKTNDWIIKTKLISQSDWEKHYKEVI